MPLTGLGWSPFFAEPFEVYRCQGYRAMRITRVNRESYVASNGAGDFFCEVTGKFGFPSGGKSDFPTMDIGAGPDGVTPQGADDAGRRQSTAAAWR